MIENNRCPPRPVHPRGHPHQEPGHLLQRDRQARRQAHRRRWGGNSTGLDFLAFPTSSSLHHNTPYTCAFFVTHVPSRHQTIKYKKATPRGGDDPQQPPAQVHHLRPTARGHTLRAGKLVFKLWHFPWNIYMFLMSYK